MPYYGNRKRNAIAVEMIAAQDKSFGLTIENIITPLCSDIKDGVISSHSELKKRPELDKLKETIFNRLGLSVVMKFSDFIPAGTYPVYLNDYTPASYRSVMGKGMSAANKKELKKLTQKGTVDTKNAKLSGSFKDLVSDLYIDYLFLIQTYNMSIGEIVAVILHELGHIFTGIEYSTRLINANFILEDISEVLKDDSFKNKESYIHSKLLDIDANVPEMVATAMASGDKLIAGEHVITLLTNVATGSGYASSTDGTSERLADMFASRFSYGRQLVSALAKMEKFNTPDSILMTADIYTMSVLVISLLVGGPFGNYIAGYVGGIVLALNFFPKDISYDSVNRRLTKIRNSTVDVLKSSDLPLERKKEILKDIQTMDEVTAGMSDEYVTLLRRFTSSVSPRARYLKNQLERDDLLEGLASNDLFVKSASIGE